MLDGGMGTELLRRGVTFPFPKEVWSGTAVRDAPDVIREVHEDYLLAGADIVTTNSFGTSRAKLASVGLGDEMEEFQPERLLIWACEARDKNKPASLRSRERGGRRILGIWPKNLQPSPPCWQRPVSTS